MAMIINLNIDAENSRLRSRSLICFISLKEHSTVAVDTGSTMAMVSRILGKVTHFVSLLRNSVASSFNDKLFSSKMTNLKPFHSCLVSVLSTSAGVEKTFPSTQSQLSPHRILGASPILQCHICAVAGHLLGISVDRRC